MELKCLQYIMVLNGCQDVTAVLFNTALKAGNHGGRYSALIMKGTFCFHSSVIG